ncbi:MAG: response regulator, partial [Lachnospiraceae bacterium]|nr:response regulator [Lachnospiraceae bacterium]
MFNKTGRFLIVSLIIVILICIGNFTWQVREMNDKSSETINEVGEIYMEGMSKQITMHFGTIMELRLSQATALVHDIMPNSSDYDEICELLAHNAKARGFDRLAFCMEDGTFDTIYGDGISAVDSAGFMNAINNGEERMAIGTDATGNYVILMSVPMSYETPDGISSISLVTGFPVDYIADALNAELSDSFLYYSIIRRDGIIVMQSDGADDRNYYDKIQRNYNSAEENSKTRQDLEDYRSELQTAMSQGLDYSKELTLSIGRRQLYCKALPHSEWYLILSMPYNDLDKIVDSFSDEWSIVALRNAISIILLFLVIFVIYFYITHNQMKNLNAARRMAEYASKAKSEFLSNMSHDIRTPMNGIMGMTEIALSSVNNPHKVEECLQKISLSAKHLLGLINDILDMSKLESTKMILNTEQISLPDMMHDVVNMIMPHVRIKQQRFDLHIQDIAAEHVWGDGVRLNQILLNLLNNAIKYTPEGGNIQLDLYQTPSDKGGNYISVHINVKDNGIGMSAAFQEKIFEAFMREDDARIQKAQGAGLGMTITKHIIDAMEGTISVKSKQGKGSEFHIILDMEMALQPEEAMEIPPWKTLVVDDDEIFCSCTLTTLKSIGIEAQRALDGRTALRMIDEHQWKGDDYDVILMDWKLPEMDGIEVTREIRQKYGTTPRILMISASDNIEVEEKAKQAGVDGFIVKPLFKSTLYYNLNKLKEETENVHNSEEKISFNGERILIAEDIDLNWEIASALLSEVGFEPEHAENGKICVEKFSESYVGYYKAILMDIRMPIMNGLEAAKAIRSLNR